mmetsp:Transcript_51599/g.102349  ORF Transcript_51599/g.102349 Transcript_51599/m.102349 type:complete len:191 (+) Transcript_51599:137-709(+)
MGVEREPGHTTTSVTPSLSNSSTRADAHSAFKLGIMDLLLLSSRIGSHPPNNGVTTASGWSLAAASSSGGVFCFEKEEGSPRVFFFSAQFLFNSFSLIGLLKLKWGESAEQRRHLRLRLPPLRRRVARRYDPSSCEDPHAPATNPTAQQIRTTNIHTATRYFCCRSCYAPLFAQNEATSNRHHELAPPYH